MCYIFSVCFAFKQRSCYFNKKNLFLDTKKKSFASLALECDNCLRYDTWICKVNDNNVYAVHIS